MLCLVPATAAAQNIEPADTVAAENGMTEHYIDGEMLVKVPEEMTPATENPAEEGADDTPLNVVTSKDYHPYGLDGKREFNPDPTRAVWMSALFPGLGQVYNRRYWKLPIIVAGYMGLGYGTSWNARMFADYQLAYSDIMDDDPDTSASSAVSASIGSVCSMPMSTPRCRISIYRKISLWMSRRR